MDFCATLGSGEFRDGNDQIGISASVLPGLLGVTQAGSSLAAAHPDSLHPDGLHTEWQWCRWYGGNFSLADGSASWPEFRPQFGERVAMVGDWVVDGKGQPASLPGSNSFTELHEPRIMSTLRQVSGQGNTYHLLTSGFFADATAQASQIAVTVPLVPATGGLKLSPTFPPPATGSGCTEDGVSPPLVTCDNTDPAAPSCRIELDCSGCQVSQHVCESNHGRDACPCHGAGGGLTETCSGPGIHIDSSGNPQNYNRCQPVAPGGGSTNQGTTLAWAGDVEVQYLPDPDLWICNCDCQDPSAPGAVVPAQVQGCAAGFRDDVASQLIPACQAACGGAMCGAAPDCHLGTCTAADPNQTNLAGIVARDAASCGIGAPPTRVAEAADYRVDLDHSSSFATITHDLCILGGCLTIGVGTPAVQGSIWLNQAADGSLEIVDAALAFDDVNFGGLLGLAAVTTAGVTAYISNRFDAQPRGGTSYTVDPMVAGDQVGLGVRGVINGQSGGADLMNQSGMGVTFDLATNTFALDGGGSEGSTTVALSLKGTIVDHPPVAVPGPDRSVECASHTTTPIPLDGSGSYDPDPGDSISHYQWFDITGGGFTGVGNQAVSTAQAPFGGPYAFLLDVYDGELGSNEHSVNITVVDTTPPTVSSFDYSGPACLWPPDHKFVVLRVGRDFTADVTDICDPSPKLIVEAATSSQSVLGGGSGNTSPDVVVFPDHICLRAERDGTERVGRTYTVTLAGMDFAGNRSGPIPVEIQVPHDQSGHCAPQRGSLEIVEDGDPLCDPSRK